MTAPAPPLNVTAHLHGGPCDTNIVMLPWARLEIPMPVWDDTDTLEASSEALYRLRGPWLGQPEAHYDYVLPELDPVPPRWWRRLFR